MMCDYKLRLKFIDTPMLIESKQEYRVRDRDVLFIDIVVTPSC